MFKSWKNMTAAMFESWENMTAAEREEINRQEDVREARKAAMYRPGEEDEGYYYQGDPHRCPSHPNVVTSSADGLHDTPCGACEYGD